MCLYLQFPTLRLKSVLLRHLPALFIMSYLGTFILASAYTPDIDVLHYGINISRVANYERFLFKRLSGFSKQLFNCSTQPYQCKSRRPCKEKKKKNKVLLTIRLQKRVSHCKSEVSVQSLSTQMLTWIICVQRKTMYH